MTPTFLSSVKRAAFLEALALADYVQIVCTTHEIGVVIPTQYRKDPTIPLNIGYRLPVPIADLVIDEWGICGTLSFGRAPFYVKLPWTCVWHINHPGIPVGMMFSIEPGSVGISANPQGEKIPVPPSTRPALKLVKS